MHIFILEVYLAKVPTGQEGTHSPDNSLKIILGEHLLHWFLADP
jgi:hypothetical protein